MQRRNSRLPSSLARKDWHRELLSDDWENRYNFTLYRKTSQRTGELNTVGIWWSSSPREQANTCTMDQLTIHLYPDHQKVLPLIGPNYCTISPLTSKVLKKNKNCLVLSYFHSSRRTQQPWSFINASSKERVLQTPSETSMKTLIPWSIVAVQVWTMSTFSLDCSQKKATESVNLPKRSISSASRCTCRKLKIRCNAPPILVKSRARILFRNFIKFVKGYLSTTCRKESYKKQKCASSPEYQHHQVSIRPHLKMLHLIVFYEPK